MKEKNILRIFDIRGNNDEKDVACLKIFINDNEIYSHDIQDISDCPEDAMLCRDLSFVYDIKLLFLKGIDIDFDSVEIKEYNFYGIDNALEFFWAFDINKYINEEK